MKILSANHAPALEWYLVETENGKLYLRTTKGEEETVTEWGGIPKTEEGEATPVFPTDGRSQTVLEEAFEEMLERTIDSTYDELRVGKKDYVCSLCHRTIYEGTKHVFCKMTPWRGGDGFYEYRAHPDCHMIWDEVGVDVDFLLPTSNGEWTAMVREYAKT